MNRSKRRNVFFSFVFISAVLILSVLTLYAHYWLIPLYEMSITDGTVNEEGTIVSVRTAFVTEPERHRQKYTVFTLQNGQNLYLYHTLAAYLEQGYGDVNALVNTQVQVAYLRRDTFGTHGHILVSFRIDGENKLDSEDTARVFWHHIREPVHTAAATLTVLWTVYVSLCLLPRIRKCVLARRKKMQKVRKKRLCSTVRDENGAVK